MRIHFSKAEVIFYRDYTKTNYMRIHFSEPGIIFYRDYAKTNYMRIHFELILRKLFVRVFARSYTRPPSYITQFSYSPRQLCGCPTSQYWKGCNFFSFYCCPTLQPRECTGIRARQDGSRNLFSRQIHRSTLYILCNKAI